MVVMMILHADYNTVLQSALAALPCTLSMQIKQKGLAGLCCQCMDDDDDNDCDNALQLQMGDNGYETHRKSLAGLCCELTDDDNDDVESCCCSR